MNFRNKTVIITGASSGIGKALAREFGKLGANVVAGARNEEKLQELINEITSQGGKAVYAVTDVTDE